MRPRDERGLQYVRHAMTRTTQILSLRGALDMQYPLAPQDMQ